jgi:chaperonin GroEL (HSP60 family)
MEQRVNIEDEETLMKIASTSLNSKIVALNKEHFSDLLVKYGTTHSSYHLINESLAIKAI